MPSVYTVIVVYIKKHYIYRNQLHMNINDLILPFALMIVVFAISLFTKKAKTSYQFVIAGIAVAYSIVACFVTEDRSVLFITVLGISWLVKLYNAGRKLSVKS